jgi:hypothetical protein
MIRVHAVDDFRFDHSLHAAATFTLSSQPATLRLEKVKTPTQSPASP